MSLDVTILDEHDRIIHSVGLEPAEHDELMRLATQARLGMLLRMSDYYADASIAVHELPSLLNEVQLLVSGSALHMELHALLPELASVIQRAIAEQRPLSVLAD